MIQPSHGSYVKIQDSRDLNIFRNEHYKKSDRYRSRQYGRGYQSYSTKVTQQAQTSLERRDGWLHFQYEDGLLIQVTDSMGNQLLFTYTENRQMASVSSSMGHKLCFGYKGSIVRTAGDYLVSVENEEGKQILKAEYGSSNSAEVHRDSVYYLEGDGQPKRWFTYNPYVEEKNTCETGDGRALIFDHSDSLEGQAEWNWYDREGKLIHQHRRPEWK